MEGKPKKKKNLGTTRKGSRGSGSGLFFSNIQGGGGKRVGGDCTETIRRFWPGPLKPWGRDSELHLGGGKGGLQVSSSGV